MELRVLGGVSQTPREAWNGLVRDGSPFLEWEWLATLEETGCVGPATGWLPQPLTAWEAGRLVGAAPLYVKGHSQGEFVFDHGWADAAIRAGIEYYPKLLVGVPFTPVTGARFLSAEGYEPAVREVFAAALVEVCTRQAFSSVHVNFCLPDEVSALAARGWLHRTGYQYHWTGQGLRTFEDYLHTLRAKRRNQVRREQRELQAQGVEITTHAGGDIDAGMLDAMFDLYRRGLADHGPWGHQYLTAEFFARILERYRDRLCLIFARRGGEIIAGTLNVQKGGALYGRYWGVHRPLRHLHFNVCYYAAIAYCVEHGLSRFEPGAGGEWKHLRGFDAHPTHSMHWIREPRFAAAVRRHLEVERAAVVEDIAWHDARSAHRRDREDG